MTKGLSGAGFDLDLRRGQLREGALGSVLAAQGDLIEVKSDQRAFATGRIFVEVVQRGRPSGLAISEAHWWAYEVDRDQWLVVTRDWLRAQVALARRLNGLHRGGDFDEYVGVLVDLDQLIPQRARAKGRHPLSRPVTASAGVVQREWTQLLADAVELSRKRAA